MVSVDIKHQRILSYLLTETKILEVHFKSDTSAHSIEDNWCKKPENMDRIIKQWSRRNLSIYGKVLTAKTLIISQFIYIMQSVGLPEKTWNIINQKLYTFIRKRKYNNKKAFQKVKRKVLTQDIDKGGLKMVDMKSYQNALYLSWVPKLMASNIDNPYWKTLPTLFFSKLGKGLDIFNTCCQWTDLIGMPKHAGEFWRNVLQTWVKLKMKFKDELPQSVCPKCT